MGDFINVSDLTPFDPTIDEAKANAMIEDAEAMAKRLAPCITGDTFTEQAAVKAILRGAILRWNDAGTAGGSTNQAGEFVLTVAARRSLFWPSEIEQLKGLCASSGAGKAFAVDTAPRLWGIHALACAITFGALYCSCGADLTLGLPLYEDDCE